VIAARDLKVLFVTSALGVGGAEVWIMALLEYLAASGEVNGVRMKIDICMTSGRTAHFDKRAAELGARLFYIEYSRRNAREFVTRFRQILDEGDYDVIHDHQDYHAGWHLLAALGHLPPKRIVHIHNTYRVISSVQGRTPSRRLTLKAGKWLVSRLATEVMGTSQQVLADYGFTGPEPRSSVVRCGFDVDDFASSRERTRAEVQREFGWGDNAKVMLFVGRLDGSFNQKNHPFAVEVAAAMAARDPDFKLLLAGSGDAALREARQVIESRKLEDSIKFLGHRSDIARLMLAADLLLFPSIAEGLGMVAVEAQAAGVRVLASDAIPRECEVIPDAVTFMPLDLGPENWAAKARSLIDLPDPDHRQWNEQVRRSAYSIDQSAARLIEVYTRA
jgi:glycosyltransferase involved in cell wall biosynthesis